MDYIFLERWVIYKGNRFGNPLLGIAFNWFQTEDAADDGEMPPLEGAEEDASRMEEVITNEM